jgi:hypothetical protein
MFQATLPVIPEIAAALPDAKRDAVFRFTSVRELADYAQAALAEPGTLARINGTGGSDKLLAEMAGGMGWREAFDAARNGHAEGVAESDAYLAQLENEFHVPTARRTVRDDVTGAVPNVPAFIAGQPLTMRRRIVTENEYAPIAVVVNPSAAANITAGEYRRRGAAVLALVRALASRRPVELWLAYSIDRASKAETTNWLLAPIDTAPLDVSRAAFLLAHPACLRRMFFAAVSGDAMKSGLRCAYRNPTVARDYYPHAVRRLMSHVSEVVTVPRANKGDLIIADPLAWLREHVKAALGDDVADAA